MDMRWKTEWTQPSYSSEGGLFPGKLPPREDHSENLAFNTWCPSCFGCRALDNSETRLQPHCSLPLPLHHCEVLCFPFSYTVKISFWRNCFKSSYLLLSTSWLYLHHLYSYLSFLQNVPSMISCTYFLYLWLPVLGLSISQLPLFVPNRRNAHILGSLFCSFHIPIQEELAPLCWWCWNLTLTPAPALLAVGQFHLVSGHHGPFNGTKIYLCQTGSSCTHSLCPIFYNQKVLWMQAGVSPYLLSSSLLFPQGLLLISIMFLHNLFILYFL